MFKVNNSNTRIRCEICSNLTIKTPERRSSVTPCSVVSIVNFEQVNGGWEITQSALPCLKSTIETPKQCVKSVRN